MQLKTRRTAKCSSCKCDKEMKLGLLCLFVSGGLSVIYHEEETALRKVCFYPVKNCIYARPPWTNIKLLPHITRDGFVFETEFNRIRQELEM